MRSRRHWYALGVVALLLAVVAVVVVQRAREAAPAGAPPRPTATPLACPGCLPAPDRPGPAIDLGVQSSDRDRLRPRAEVDQLVARAREAGASIVSTVVRFDADMWPDAAGPLDLSSVERTAAAVADAGLELRVTVYGLPAWAYDDRAPAAGDYRPPRSPAELTTWRTLVTRLVQRLGDRLDYLEVWNEPNNPAYWAGPPDPAAFARLLVATEPLVRAAAPRVRVVSGGIAGNDLSYLRRLTAALGPRTPYDLLGLHPFTPLPPDETGAEHADDAYDQRFTGIATMARIARTAGHDRPLYVTSFGYSVGPGLTDGDRSRYLTAALGRATAQPGLAALSWYYLAPTPWDEPRWTLLDRNLRPTATYHALRQWSRMRERLTR